MLPLEVFTWRNFVADFIRQKLNFVKNTQKLLFEHPLGDLEVTYALCQYLVGKPVVNLLFIIIELFFRYFVSLRRYKRKSVEVGIFRRGGSVWVQVSDGRDVPHKPLLMSEWLAFRMVSKYLQCIVWFYNKARMWRTDGHTELTPR